MTQLLLRTTTTTEKTRAFLLQLGILFLLLLTVPLSSSYFYTIKNIHIGDIHFQDLFQLVNYIPLPGQSSPSGLQSFEGWLWAFAAAVLLAAAWSRFDKNFFIYEPLWYYGLRVVLRYRLAAALFSYGLLLVFAVQAPYPAISDLHTKYGYFLPWRIYYDSLAVSSAGYAPALGLIEILGGILLLFRRTAIFGAGIAAFVLINIVLANFAYDLGDQVLSVYLLLIALVLIAYDGPRLYELLYKEKKTFAEKFAPVFIGNWARVRQVLKGAFILFLFAYTLLLFKERRSGKWPYPDSPGLPNAAGFYDVKHFNFNGGERPYSLVDSIRWEDVVFEQWNTLSINAHRPTPINFARPSITYAATTTGRTYENLGNGQRLFYSYVTKGDSLLLVNKNDGNDTYAFTLSRPHEGQILLQGLDRAGNKLVIELNRLDKKYLLLLGRRRPVKVY